MEILQIAASVLGIILLYLVTCIRILKEYQRGVVFRLGRVLSKPKGPGFVLVFWPVDVMVRVSLRTFVQDVPSQDVITRDNVSVEVNAVVYFRVVDPMKSVLEVVARSEPTLTCEPAPKVMPFWLIRKT